MAGGKPTPGDKPGAAGASAGSTSTGGSASATAVDADPTGGAEAAEESLTPVGVGDSGDLPVAAAGSLDGILDRLPRGNGPWTRSIRLAIAALLPMVLGAGVALWRWSPPPPGPDDR